MTEVKNYKDVLVFYRDNEAYLVDISGVPILSSTNFAFALKVFMNEKAKLEGRV